MSGVEKINSKILQDAQESSRIKIDLAMGRARKITDAARREAGQKIQALLSEADRTGSEVYKRIVALAEIELRKEKLKTRQELIQAAFDRTLEMLCNMPEEQYCGFLAGMMARALGDFEEEAEIVLSPADRERIGPKLLDRVPGLLREMGEQARIRLSDATADIRGGFILRTEELELNYSFEAILRTEQEPLQKLACSKLGLA